MNPSKDIPLQNNQAKLSLKLLSLRYLMTWTGIAILRLSVFLPYNFLMKFGNGIGMILYKISPHRSEIVKINIKKCLGIEGKELEHLVRSNFKALGRGFFETAIAWWASNKKIKALSQNIVNEHLIDQLDSGALVLIKHSTHLELDLRILSNYFDLTGMYKNQTNAVVNYVMINSRNKYVKASASNNEAMKAIRWINKGEKFIYAADQDYGLKVSAMIPFFGSDAATVTFPALFSRKNIKIIMADVSKIDECYVIEFAELNNTEDEKYFLSSMNECYEEFIKKEPEGYLWMHRRFKSGSENAIYPKWSSREKRRAKRRMKRD